MVPSFGAMESARPAFVGSESATLAFEALAFSHVSSTEDKAGSRWGCTQFLFYYAHAADLLETLPRLQERRRGGEVAERIKSWWGGTSFLALGGRDQPRKRTTETKQRESMRSAVTQEPLPNAGSAWALLVLAVLAVFLLG